MSGMSVGGATMSGMSVGGLIMVQESQQGGFIAHVYQTRLAAAIQLLRSEIRRAPDSEAMLLQVQLAVAELMEEERKELQR